MPVAPETCSRARVLLGPWRGVKGSYLILALVRLPVRVRTRGRRFALGPGYYAYVGSARGPGGLASRLLRHVCRRGKPFWHIDFLLRHRHVSIVGWALLEGLEERVLALVLGSAYDGIRGFGGSDDVQSKSHLFRVPNLESLFSLIKSLGSERAMVVLVGDGLEVLPL